MLKIIATADGQFDLAYETKDDDIKKVRLLTIIYTTLFTDQRAPEGRVDDQLDQRGWWFDPQLGTGLWYVRRQALSDAARLETLNMVAHALEEQDPLLTDVHVIEVLPQTYDDRLRNVSRVVLDIAGLYDGIRFELSRFTLPDQATIDATGMYVWDSTWDFRWFDD